MKLNITSEERKSLKETFKNFGRPKTKEEIFYDLCFCINAPQTTFKNNIKVNYALHYADFYNWIIVNDKDIKVLQEILKPVRFYRNKTKYLLEMKKNFNKIYQVSTAGIISMDKPIPYFEIREWLVKNVKGLGYKTASHFLRNLGSKDLAIIDTHIIKFLSDIDNNKPIGFINKPPYTKDLYLCYEQYFSEIARYNNLTVAELDALIWQRYSGTKWEDFKY